MNWLERSGAMAAIVTVACMSATCLGSSEATGPSNGPTLSALSPSSGPVGTAVVVRATGLAAFGNTVRFGQGYLNNLRSEDGTTVRMTVPDGLDLCPPDGGPCPEAFPRVVPGDYAVAIVVNGQTSNSMQFTVTER